MTITELLPQKWQTTCWSVYIVFIEILNTVFYNFYVVILHVPNKKVNYSLKIIIINNCLQKNKFS